MSVEPPKRNWQSLERKISQGTSIEEAAVEAGIPLEEVFDYVSGRLKAADTLDWQLRLVAGRALETSMTKLMELAEGEERFGQNFESTDLLAAKELARIALAAMKLTKASAAKQKSDTSPDDDIFDRWKLNKMD